MAGRTVLVIIKKSVITTILLVLLGTTLAGKLISMVQAQKAYYPLAGKKIVIDAGHGGVDSGANDATGFKEKKVNLETALKLRDILVWRGAEVIMTREDDSDVTSKGDPGKKRYHRDLDGRKNVMNNSEADIFLSLHVNSCPGAKRTRGAYVFYFKKSAESEVLAESLAGHLNNFVKKHKRDGELASHDPRTQDYFILRNAKIPAVLIEIGFMTHAEEKKLLMDEGYQRALAETIADGVVEYFINLAQRKSKE